MMWRPQGARVVSRWLALMFIVRRRTLAMRC
jgi:hypothetical protein